MTSPIDRLVLAGTVLCAYTAHADGVVTMHGREVVATPQRGGPCDDDTTCATALLRALSGLAFGTITGTVGGERGGVAGGVTVEAVSGDYPVGRFAIGRFDARYLPDRPIERLRFALVDADVLFPCRDHAGELHLPIDGQTRYACAESRFGIGATLGELQWDPTAGRVAARWAELQLVGDVLGTSNSMAYLHHHLDVSLGVAGESVWHGTGEMRIGSDHAARGVVAVTARVRSADARWELRANAEARPVLVGTTATFTDVGLLASGAVLYHTRAGSSTTVSTGIEVHADRWSDPSTSIGVFDSTTDNRSLFVGALLEVRHESPR